jgi:hypothetical protein
MVTKTNTGISRKVDVSGRLMHAHSVCRRERLALEREQKRSSPKSSCSYYLKKYLNKQSHLSRDHRYCPADEGLDECTKETRLGQK